MLKLIPQETAQSQKRKEKKTKFQERYSAKFQSASRKDASLENRHIQRVCMHLAKYIKKAEQYGIKEMGDLIHIVQRSVLTLQKQRIKLIRKQQKRK